MSRNITYTEKSGISTLTITTNNDVFLCQIPKFSLKFLNELFIKADIPKFETWVNYCDSDELPHFFALIYGVHILASSEEIRILDDVTSMDLVEIESVCLDLAEKIGLEHNDVFIISQILSHSYAMTTPATKLIVSADDIQNNWMHIHNQFYAYLLL
jgi:hypothetical protein